MSRGRVRVQEAGPTEDRVQSGTSRSGDLPRKPSFLPGGGFFGVGPCTVRVTPLLGILFPRRLVRRNSDESFWIEGSGTGTNTWRRKERKNGRHLVSPHVPMGTRGTSPGRRRNEERAQHRGPVLVCQDIRLAACHSSGVPTGCQNRAISAWMGRSFATETRVWGRLNSTWSRTGISASGYRKNRSSMT